MKILILVPYYPPAVMGQGVLAQRLADGLGRRGHQVTVLTSPGARPPSREEASAAVRVLRQLPPAPGGGMFSPACLWRILREMRRHVAALLMLPAAGSEMFWGGVWAGLLGRTAAAVCWRALPEPGPARRRELWVCRLARKIAVVGDDRWMQRPELRGLQSKIERMPPLVPALEHISEQATDALRERYAPLRE